MRKISLGFLSVLLVLTMLFCIVACKEEVQPEQTPETKPETKVLTYDFYMSTGWSEETPVWTSKDTGTVDVEAPVFSGDGEHVVTNVTDNLKNALTTALATDNYFKDVKA